MRMGRNERQSKRHVLDAIEACLDGELTVEANAAVREHVAGCGACGRAWTAALRTRAVLADCPAPEPPAAAWPGLRARLAPARRPARPAFALGLATGLAGLLLGLALGRAMPARSPRGATESSALVAWAAEGTLLVEGGATTLDGLYLATVLNGDAGAERSEAQ